MTKTRVSLVTALLAIAAVGCSDGARRLSPVGPSVVAGAPAPTAPAALVSWATANGWSATADGRVAVADGILVEGVDVVGSVTGSCPSRTLTVRGVPVAVTPSTVFSSSLTCSALASGMTIKVTGMLSYAASGYSVVAVQVASAGDEGSRAPSSSPGGERLSGEGVVMAVSGECPSLTMVVLGYQVLATGTTQYAGAGCASVREGTLVRLDVEKHSDGTIVAQRVEVVSQTR